MTVAQANIRRLFEQVRSLEAEAAARPPRRRTRDRALVVVAAAAIGAASAGTQHALHVAAPAAPVQTMHAVAHLIDAPAERAHALPVTAPHRTAVHVHPRSAEPLHATASHNRLSDESSPSAVRTSVAGSLARPAPTARPVAAVHVVAAVHAARVRPVVSHAVAPARRNPPAPPLVTPAPVGIGPVVVATADEPVTADDPGASPAPAP